MIITRLLDVLAQRCPVLPPTVHRAAAADARRRGDRRQICRLVGRPDTPRDVLADLATIDDPEVQTSFLLRVGPPEIHVPVTSAVLSSALAQAGGAVQVDVALKYLEQTGDQDLARRLLYTCLPRWLRAEEVYQVLSVAQPLADLRASFSLWHLTEVVARLGPDLGNELLATTTCPTLVAALSLLPVDHSTLRGALARVTAGQLSSRQERWLRAAVNASDRDPDEVRDLQEVLGPASRDDPDRPEGVASCRSWNQDPLIPRDRLRDEDLAHLGATRDPALAAQVVAAALRNGTAPTIGWLLRNPAVTAEDRARILQYLRSTPRAAASVLDWVDVYDPDDAELTAVLREHAPLRLLELYGWDPFGGPDHAAEAIRELWQRRDVEHSPEAVARAVAGAHVPRPVWAHLPWSMVPYLLAPREPASRFALVPGLARWVADQLDDLLQTGGPAAMSALEGIGEEFDGTIGDLLQVCRAVLQ